MLIGKHTYVVNNDLVRSTFSLLLS